MISDNNPILKKVSFYSLDLPWNPAVLNFDSINRTVHTSSMLQVKKKLSANSIGSWKKYAPYLGGFAKQLKSATTYLQRYGGLPFPDTINWDLDVDFDYGAR